ncbi:MAG TPA: TonB family protein [Flavobacteriales bacterium]|nr:TonB family protein [Flavobacteriales bacterium]
MVFVQAQKPKHVINYYYKKLKSSEGDAIKGVKTGAWKYWDTDGNLLRIETYLPDSRAIKISGYHDYFDAKDFPEVIKLEKTEYEQKLAQQNKPLPHPLVEGFYLDNLKENVWKIYDKQGNLLSEKAYVRDTLNGLAVEFDPLEPKHMVTRITWFMGKFNGMYMTESRDRTEKTEGAYSNGLKTGRWETKKSDNLYIEYYKDGELNGTKSVFYKEKPVTVERFSKGVLDGEFSKYLYDGETVKRLTGKYKNGKRNGTFRIYQGDVLKSEWNLSDEVRNGPQKLFYENGKVRSHEVWRNGVLDSVRTTWDEDGKLETRSFYEKGELKKDQDFYQNGKIRQEFIYTSRTQATRTTWDEKGRKTKSETVPVMQSNEPSFDFLNEFRDENGKKNSALKDSVYMLQPEVPAEFPGGNTEMMKFIAKHIHYPEMAKEAGVSGKVFISFVVDTDGSITNVKSRKSPDPSLEREAIRVVKLFPNFIPAKTNGRAVKQFMTVPISFVLK